MVFPRRGPVVRSHQQGTSVPISPHPRQHCFQVLLVLCVCVLLFIIANLMGMKSYLIVVWIWVCTPLLTQSKPHPSAPIELLL